MNTDWNWLREINIGNDPLVSAFDCFSVFAENKGILVVLSEDEVVSIKLTVTTDNEQPLKVGDIARMKGIKGLSIVRDHRNSFLLTKDKKIFAFKSFKRIFDVPALTNIKFFECFRNSCYAVIEQVGIEVKLLLYDSFGEEFDVCKCEIDLSFLEDAVTAGGSRNDERINVEMIEGASDRKFFSELLACDLDEQQIVDVCLMSIDEKLLWVKFKESFKEGAVDGYSIETVTVAKEKIRGLKYNDGILMMLDDRSVLTVFYLCPVTQLIRKNEIVLEGKVKCFRFHGSVFIYSNLDKIGFMDLKKPQEPTTVQVRLKGITCFTVVDHRQRFIIGICWNQKFYNIAFPSQYQQPKKKDQFEELESSDIEAIPEVARFLENGEKKLLEIEQKIKHAQMLKNLLDHLRTQRNFVAGEATVNFHQNFPHSLPEDAIVCKVTDQKLGSEFIEIKIKLSRIFNVLNVFMINFDREGSNGTMTRTLKVERNKENVHILMPAESGDDATNKMSLELFIAFDFTTQTRLLTYPIRITKVTSSTEARICFRDSLDVCLETVENMKL